MTVHGRRALAIAALGVIALAAGCGARTGLDPGESTDADLGPAPDVFGPFPCTYSPAGEPVSVTPWGDVNCLRPVLAYGEGRFGLTFGSGADPAGWSGLCFCTFQLAEPECGGICLDADADVPVPLLSVDDSWSFCVGGTLWRTDQRGVSVETFEFEPRTARCSGLAWSGERYVAATVLDDDALGPAEILALDPAGRPLESLVEVEPAAAWNPGTVDADDGMEAAAWATASSIVIRRLDGVAPFVELVATTASPPGPVALALRRPVAGVLWVEGGAGGERLLFRLADLEGGQLAGPIALATAANVSGLAIVDVAEGFVVAWGEWGDGHDRIVVMPLSVDGWEVLTWTPVVIYDGPHDEAFELAGGPSLAHDGRSPTVAYSRLVTETGEYQVFLQYLDCHR